MQLNVRQAGRTDGPAIAFLHGFMSCNAQWQLNEKTLGASCRLIEIELWGHGASPLPPAGEVSIDGYLAQFEQIRKAHGIDQWFLVGHSYGAGLMLSYAQAHPDRCCAVVATNSRSAFREPVERASPMERIQQRLASAAGVEALRQLPYHPIHARRFPPAVHQALIDSADRMDPQAVRYGGELVAALNFRHRLETLAVPVMIANGTWEKSFQRDLASMLPQYDQITVAELPGGHSINIEAPEAFDAAVLQFLAAAQRGELAAPVRR
jgi:pimeloyl-ACP methyl ester carboxylesterase